MAENFNPGETISLTAQPISGAVLFGTAQGAQDPDCMVTNAGGQIAFVAFGSGLSVAAALPGSGVLNATPVLPGESIILHKGQASGVCAAVTPSGSTTLYFTAGQGN